MRNRNRRGGTDDRRSFVPPLTGLLPPSSLLLENNLVTLMERLQTLRETEDGEIPIRHLWNVDKCPGAFLPYLACAFGVNTAVFAFSDEQIRNAIKNSIALHEIRGTVQSVYKVVQDLNIGATLIEGRDDPTLEWWQFKVTLTNPVPLAQKKALVTLIEDVAPVRCELIGFDFTGNPHSYSGYTDPDNPADTYDLTYNGTYSYGVI